MAGTVTVVAKTLAGSAVDTMPSNVTTSSTSFVDITNLTIEVPANMSMGGNINCEEPSVESGGPQNVFDFNGINSTVATPSNAPEIHVEDTIVNTTGSTNTFKGEHLHNVGGAGQSRCMLMYKVV